MVADKADSGNANDNHGASKAIMFTKAGCWNWQLFNQRLVATMIVLAKFGGNGNCFGMVGGIGKCLIKGW